jgi:hypothetical protein
VRLFLKFFRLAPSLPPPPAPQVPPLPPPPLPSRSQRRKRSRPRVGGGPRASASGAAASRPAAGEAVTEAGETGGSEFYVWVSGGGGGGDLRWLGTHVRKTTTGIECAILFFIWNFCNKKNSNYFNTYQIAASWRSCKKKNDGDLVIFKKTIHV